MKALCFVWSVLGKRKKGKRLVFALPWFGVGGVKTKEDGVYPYSLRAGPTSVYCLLYAHPSISLLASRLPQFIVLV